MVARLAAAETGSQSYLSALLGFDDADGEEWDPESEELASRFVGRGIELIGELTDFLKALKQDKRFNGWRKQFDDETLTFLNNLK